MSCGSEGRVGEWPVVSGRWPVVSGVMILLEKTAAFFLAEGQAQHSLGQRPR
ncbi:hypothetical protein Pan258_60720 [Symmachiella dynata]|nr:hypothetical protein Pan258_60720 [Symmachiella dynata]